MTTDELETLLRKWGYAYGERRTPEWGDEPPENVHVPASHPIARGMEFAPGRRSAVIRQRTNMDRGGQARRKLMAAGANAGCKYGVGFRTLPSHFVEPIPCVETRTGRNEARDWPVPTELQRVQRAALDLHAIDTVRGLVLRVNYCTLGPQDDKALVVAQRLGASLGLRMYREALAHAKGWMHGRLAA